MTTMLDMGLDRGMKAMSPKEYAAAIERLGFYNRGFCNWLGYDERTGRKWLAGTCPIPAGVAAFLRLALAEGRYDADLLRKTLKRFEQGD